MIQIKDKQHVSVIIESLNKIYKKAKIYGKLEIKDIYYLNILKKLLDNEMFILSLDENNLIINLYNKLSFNSKIICPPIIYKDYQTTPIKKFEQAEVKDCNNYNSFKRIFYWQEEFEVTKSQIENNINFDYLDDKPYDSYEVFEIGKDISLDKIGYLSFFLLDSLETDQYIIKDILNNDVTHAFTNSYNNSLKGHLFISNNKYTHSLMNLKIIKNG